MHNHSIHKKNSAILKNFDIEEKSKINLSKFNKVLKKGIQ